MDEFFKIKKSIFMLIGFIKSFYVIFCSTPLKLIQNLRWLKRFESYYKKNPKMDLLLLSTSVIIVSLWLFNKFSFGDYIFVNNQIDVGQDSLVGIFPYINHLFRNKEGLSFWSFNSGMGTNMFPIILTFFVDPFTIIASVFWDSIENGFIYTHILKLICISILFYKLIILFCDNRYVALLTAVIFTFNGFLMLWGQHYYFVNKVLYFLFLLYAIELYFRNKNKYLMILALVFNLTDLYFFYQTAFFILFFLIFRNLYLEGHLKNLKNQIFKVVIDGVLSILISAVFILPSIYYFLHSPRINFTNLNLVDKIFSLQTLDYYLTLFGRFFSNNLSGDALNYFGYYNNYIVAPQLCSSLLTLLLLPQLFVLKNKNEFKALLFSSSILLITLILPFFAYLFTAFQELYYRWTYGVITLNVISLAFVLNSIIRNKGLNVKLLKFTLSFLFSDFL